MENIDSYLKGITDIISSNIMPSYIVSFSLEKEDEFYNYYHISKNKIKIEVINEKYDDFIKHTFNLNGRMLETFIYLINKLCGNCKKIYYLSGEELEKKVRKYEPFYILEEVFLIEYEKMYICFIIGNNE